MAQPKTLTFGKFKVYLGDGADPETFSAPCGFTQKSLALSVATNDQPIPDCADPDAPVWTSREKSARSAAVSGSGVIAMEDYARWRAAFLSDEAVSVRVMFDRTSPDGGGYWYGKAHLTSLQHTGNFGNKSELSVSLDSDGPWAWMDAA